MKKIIPLLLLMALGSCRNNNEELINDICDSYKRNMAFTLMESEESFNHFELLYQINEAKAETFYLTGVQFRSMVNAFNQKADSLYELDDLKVEQLETLQHLNEQIMDSISCIVPDNWKDVLDTVQIDYSKKKYYQTNPKLVILLMQNDLIKNESYFMEYLKSMISVGCFSFHAIDIQISEVVRTNTRVEYFLNEEYVQLERNRMLFVDTVWRNGLIYSAQSRIQPDYSFAKITFYSLPLGNYKVKGHVKLVRNHIHDKIEDFDFNFNVN